MERENKKIFSGADRKKPLKMTIKTEAKQCNF